MASRCRRRFAVGAIHTHMGVLVMRIFYHFGLVASVAVLAIVADSTSAFAQRRGNINIGGNSNNNNNNNQDGKNRNRNRDNDNNNKNKSDNQTFQNLIQGGGQGGQSGQGQFNNNNSQYRRNNNQGNNQFNNQGLQQTFKNPQGVQQYIQGGQGVQGQSWQKQKYNEHNELQQWVVGFNGGPRPFSNDWYKNHPNAWHWQNNDNWEVATAAGVIG